MSGVRYVPNGVILICTNGASFNFFQATFHVDTTIYASNMGTEGDRWPLLNIPSFGACIATPNVPCFPSPVTWQQPRDGVSIDGFQMLLETSTAKCMRGGTVTIRFTFASLQESPSGSFKRPSEYIKDGFDWVFGKLDDNLADVRAGLADMGAPVCLQNGIDQLAWNVKASVGIVEGALNGVVGLGELIWDVATDPVGVGTAICKGVADGATKAWEWGSKGDNWTKAANDAWDWASDGENWKKAAMDADQWVKDNPRVVGNVVGEIAIEAAEAYFTGGGSLLKKGGKELLEESMEQGLKRGLKEGGEELGEKLTKEAAEQNIKKNLPEVITKEGLGDSTEKGIKEALKPGDKLPDWNGPVDYSDIKNPKTAGEGKNFNKSQKDQIYEKNRAANDGYLTSDMDGTILEASQKSQKGISPSKYETQVDHKFPKSKGGENTGENAQVLSREQNRAKSNKIE